MRALEASSRPHTELGEGAQTHAGGTQQQHSSGRHPASSSNRSRLPRWLLGIAPAAAAASTAQPVSALPSRHHHGAPPPGVPGGDDGAGPSFAGGPQPLALVADSKEPIVLTVASFAVTKLAYVRLTKMFRDAYARRTGADVRFRLTFAGSGVQARAVIDGLPADIVALALPLDVQKIADAGLIPPNWRKIYPNNSTVCETTVAFVVRPGNPKGIRDWADLTKEGVQVVVANPKTAGVARWIFLALWGTKMRKGDAAARTYVTQVFDNVVVQPRDAREASDVFYRQKVGDVLLTYENEVVLTNQVYAEKALPYMVPSPNVRIECPLALVEKVVQAKGPAAHKAADEFARFCFTQEAQVEFGRVGFRPNPKLSKVAPEHLAGQPPVKMWDVDKELGGWDKAQHKFFDAGQILDQIQSEVGRAPHGGAAHKGQQIKAATSQQHAAKMPFVATLLSNAM